MKKYLLLLLLIIFALYFYRSRDKIEFYSVNNSQDMYTTYLANKLRDLDPRIENVFSKLRFFDGGNKSYSENKKDVYLCKVDENGKLYNKNQLILVMIHEISHCICKSEHHTDEFYTIFNSILDKAKEKGLIEKDWESIPGYCAY